MGRDSFKAAGPVGASESLLSSQPLGATEGGSSGRGDMAAMAGKRWTKSQEPNVFTAHLVLNCSFVCHVERVKQPSYKVEVDEPSLMRGGLGTERV
jgi:hypothetical protein